MVMSLDRDGADIARKMGLKVQPDDVIQVIKRFVEVHTDILLVNSCYPLNNIFPLMIGTERRKKN